MAVHPSERAYVHRGAGKYAEEEGVLAERGLSNLEVDIYTPVEKTLIDAGRFGAVQQMRSAFQDTMREKFSDAVEQLVGRKVIGFLSQVHLNPDLAVETFILEPDGGGDERAAVGEVQG